MTSSQPPFPAIPSHQLLYPDYSLQIQALDSFTKHIAATSSTPLSPTVYICREDTNSGLAFGGNKIRKLEFLIPDILSPTIQPPVTALVTTGGIQSNHQRAVAAVASHLGLKCILIPRAAVAKEDQPDPATYETSGNVQLAKLLGAEIRPAVTALGGAAAMETQKTAVIRELLRKGEVPYWIPSGSSTHEKGGLGYAKWAFGLDAWEHAHSVNFSLIVVACASGSTLAGMIAGFKYLEKKSVEMGFACPRKRKRVVGVDTWAAKDGNETRRTVLEIAKKTGKLIGLEEGDVKEQDVVVEREWNAGAYGRCDESTQEAMKLMARTEGILLDPVYTGKAVAGLMGLLKRDRFAEGENVLFVHTGGQPALSAYPGIL